ncbi:MAG: GNAT family N-acetyltransferase [Caulobacterales bacterium]|nr:GNAT family N-acetyltransferase [Caulobacterales bacterium]
MTDPTIRPATAADIPALHALIESAYRGEVSRAGWTTEADLLDGQRTDPDDLADIIADPAQVLLTAWRGAELVGCILIADRGRGTGYFGMLSVRPTLQAAGLGRRLVAVAERELAARFDARRVHISVFPQRDELIAWYQRLGYRDTGRTLPFDYDNPRLGLPLRDDLHFIVMSKEIV